MTLREPALAALVILLSSVQTPRIVFSKMYVVKNQYDGWRRRFFWQSTPIQSYTMEGFRKRATFMLLAWFSPKYLCLHNPVCYLTHFFLQIFTGKIPFHHLDDETVIIGQVIGGARPGKNEHIIRSDFSPSVWELVEACWQQEASRRPEISFVMDRLQTITCTSTLSSAEDADFTCRSEKRDTVPFDVGTHFCYSPLTRHY